MPNSTRLFLVDFTERKKKSKKKHGMNTCRRGCVLDEKRIYNNQNVVQSVIPSLASYFLFSLGHQDGGPKYMQEYKLQKEKVGRQVWPARGQRRRGACCRPPPRRQPFGRTDGRRSQQLTKIICGQLALLPSPVLLLLM